MGGDSGETGASEAASLVFRIATVGFSLASAIMTATSTQCVRGGATVSYSDYNSFKYSALADLLSAVLQGVAIYLEVVKKEKAAKVVELIDKVLQALTSTSAALLFAVDDITSCGVGRQRSRGRFCTQAGRFCGQIRLSSALSLAAVASVSVSVYAKHVPLSVTLTTEDAPRAPPTDDESESKPTKEAEEKIKRESPPKPPTPPTVMPRPCCGCPRRTISYGCENHVGPVNTGLADPEPEPCIHGSVPTEQTTQPHGMYSYEPQGPWLTFCE